MSTRQQESIARHLTRYREALETVKVAEAEYERASAAASVARLALGTLESTSNFWGVDSAMPVRIYQLGVDVFEVVLAHEDRVQVRKLGVLEVVAPVEKPPVKKEAPALKRGKRE